LANRSNGVLIRLSPVRMPYDVSWPVAVDLAITKRV
jgi:hypothetical protein